jgi:site-specific recombinase XerD
LPVQGPSARRLSRYLGRRRRGPLFLSDTPGRESSRLTRFGADHILKKVAATARISTRLSANALRRRYVTTAVASGSDVYDIRDHLGHRDVRTAMRYLEPSSTSQRRR